MPESTSGWLQRHHEFMASNTDTLLDVIAYSVRTAGLASFGGDAHWEARDILTIAQQRALADLDKMSRQMNQMSWMLGLACDELAKRQRERAQLLGLSDEEINRIAEQMQREAAADASSFDWVIETIMARISLDPLKTAEAKIEFEQQLARISEPDRTILRLGIMQSLDGDQMAEMLDCSPAQARECFHQAFGKLRIARTHGDQSADRRK